MGTFLVTGATGGIGRAVSERLSAAGHLLVLMARDKARLDQLASEMNNQHRVFPADISHDQSAEDFVRFMRSEGVVLDGAVLMPPQPHADSDPTPSPDVWRHLFQTSFIGPLSILKAAIDCMSPDPAVGRRAKVVIISGLSSAQVLSHYATANVIRTAWLGQAKTLAFAYGPQGVHINTISLGGTLSPWYREKISERADKAGRSFDEQLLVETDNVPLRKYGEPGEVAAVVEGLLSSLSDHMTGLNILHDGGFTRAY
jgi:3-oxoacyl-[acyl-carrier protein] reductase